MARRGTDRYRIYTGGRESGLVTFRFRMRGMTLSALAMASVLLACSSSTSPGQPEQQLNVRIASGPAQLRQGDVGQFSADVRGPDGSPAPGAAVSWSVQPSQCFERRPR